MKISFFPRKEVLGVDIGSQTIKIVELKQSKSGKPVLRKYVHEYIAKGEITPEEKKNVLIDKLKEIVQREKFTTKRAATSLSGNQVIVRYVKFPKLTPEELTKTIQFEAESYIPFDIREVNLAFYILGDVIQEGEKKMEVVLVAAKKEVIQNRIEILEKTGLEPAVINVDAFVIENALELIRKPEVKETVVAVNLGASVTNLVIIENGISRVVRDIFIAGNTFTKIVQQNLNLEFNEAEELKKRYGLTLETNDEEALKVRKVLIPAVNDLIKEIQHSIDYYQAQLPAVTEQQTEELVPSRVLLTGGSSQMPYLSEYFAHELQTPVEIFNPFDNLNISTSLPTETKEKGQFFTVAVGLASSA